MSNDDRFRGLRVLVTGDTGFKGSWLALRLHDLGASVTGFALPPEGPSPLFESLGLGRLINHVDGDIRDLPALQAAIERVRPQVVFHLAAQSLVRRGYAEPKLTFDTNVGGSVNVLEALRDSPDLRALIYVTSDKCYRNREWPWAYRECDELGGRDPYSASKAAAEIALSAYRQSYFAARPDVGTASVRAGNVIGGGDWAADRLIPDCIRAFGAGTSIVLRYPQATRPWQHVLEPIEGYLLLARRLMDDPGACSGAWNFGPEAGTARTVRSVAEAAAKLWGHGMVEARAASANVHEAASLQVSIEKAKQILGWHPRWDVDRALDRTVSWYRDVARGGSALDVTRAQIEDYAAS